MSAFRLLLGSRIGVGRAGETLCLYLRQTSNLLQILQVVVPDMHRVPAARVRQMFHR